MGDRLAEIVEEESQVEENTYKVITNFWPLRTIFI
jgi:hypothetical protein